MSTTRYRLFVGVSPGLEALLADELETLVAPCPAGEVDAAELHSGGVEVLGPREALWRVALGSRLAESLRVRLGKAFVARDFDTLLERVARLPLAAYLPRGPAGAVSVRVESRRSRLYHERAVAERIESLLRQRGLAAAHHASAENAAMRLWLRIVRDRVQVSVDAGGAALYRRGYRAHVARASLRETLAAACLRAAGYAGGPLWDPFCGAGTFLLEAAAIASGRPPAREGPLALERWPTHDAAAWQATRADLAGAVGVDDQPPQLAGLGCDVDRRAIEAARHNIEAFGRVRHGDAAAGAAMDLRIEQCDFVQIADEVPRGAAVVTNPPYGKRLRDDHRRLYRQLGDLLRRRDDLDPVVVISGNRGFARATGSRWQQLARTNNRGLPVELLRLQR